MEELKVQVDHAVVPNVTRVGLQETVSPKEGAEEVVRVTFPAKPFWLATVIVELLLEPEARLTLGGLAETLKSPGGVTVTAKTTT